MVLDTSRSSTSTVTLAATRTTIPPADPWDAPYFGGTVYFSYQPTLPALPAVHSAVATYGALPAGAREDGASVAAMGGALLADPWDAPYFGGPVYLGYHPGMLPSTPAGASAAGVSSTTSAVLVSFTFAPWDAPYFGGPVYFRYPDFPMVSFGPAAVLVAPAELEAVALGVGAETPSTDSGEQSAATAPSEAGASLPAAPQGGEAGKRRGWLARFFRRELYIGRRV